MVKVAPFPGPKVHPMLVPIGVWVRFAFWLLRFGGFVWFFAACMQVWVWGDIPPTSALVNVNKKGKRKRVRCPRARLGGRGR